MWNPGHKKVYQIQKVRMGPHFHSRWQQMSRWPATSGLLEGGSRVDPQRNGHNAGCPHLQNPLNTIKCENKPLLASIKEKEEELFHTTGCLTFLNLLLCSQSITSSTSVTPSTSSIWSFILKRMDKVQLLSVFAAILSILKTALYTVSRARFYLRENLTTNIISVFASVPSITVRSL